MKKFLVAMWQKCAKYLAEVGKSEMLRWEKDIYNIPIPFMIET